MSQEDYELAVATAQAVFRRFLGQKQGAPWDTVYDLANRFQYEKSDQIEQFASDVLAGKYADDLAHAVLCELAKRRIESGAGNAVDQYACGVLEKECERRLAPAKGSPGRPPLSDQGYWIATCVALVLMQFRDLKATRKQRRYPSACSIVWDALSRAGHISCKEDTIEDIWGQYRRQIVFK